MWYSAIALLGIAVLAEALGLGGIPAQAMETENLVFIVLLFTLIAMTVRRFGRR